MWTTKQGRFYPVLRQQKILCTIFNRYKSKPANLRRQD